MKSKAVVVSLEDRPELFDAIKRYKGLKGWTWKYFILMGIAHSLQNDGENQDLLLEIVKYLGGE